MKTFTPTPADVDRRWYVVDAAGVPLGRMATQVATLLMGKHKPTYAPHMDMGDFVVVVNAEKTVLTGRKEDQKIYYRHTTRPGSMKMETAGERRQRRPQMLVEEAVRRHAAEEPPRPRPLPQAQGLRRSGAPARGAAARALRSRVRDLTPRRQF